MIKYACDRCGATIKPVDTVRVVFSHRRRAPKNEYGILTSEVSTAHELCHNCADKWKMELNHDSTT